MTETGGQATPGPLTDDTPRDPLAAVLAVVIDGWFTDEGEMWRLVPMTADGGLSVISPASWFAEVIASRLRDAGVTLDATRPSGDEALRAALERIATGIPARRATALARAALATSSSAPDVVEIIEQHIPSLTDATDREIDELRFNSMVDRFGQPEVENADLAIRICHCGKRIDGFYEYVDHLKEVLGGDG